MILFPSGPANNSGNDSVEGSSDDDTLIGGPGQDTLVGFGGDDILDASTGSAASQGFGDLVQPGFGEDTIVGHEALYRAVSGVDLSYSDLDGFGGVRITSGPDGSGSVTGAGIDDNFTFIHYFQGSQDNDTIIGSNDDTFEGFTGFDGADRMTGNGGFNVFDYSVESGGRGIQANLNNGRIVDSYGATDTVSGVFELRGTTSDDEFIADDLTRELVLRSYAGDDTIVAGSGADFIVSDDGNDNIESGDGADSIDSGGDADTVMGGDGNDAIAGQGGKDSIHGEDGNDSLLGGTGDDTIYGGEGNDTIFGNTALDEIYGGAGDDFISSGNGVDVVDGGDGNDTIYGRTGWDTINGGDDDDFLIGSEGQDELSGGRGNDSIWGSSGWDELFGNSGNDTLFGNIGNDILSGGGDRDELFGGTGDDTLNGGSGNDTLLGNQGVDVLNGNSGNDLLRGGTLRDTFIFARGNDRDEINDFEINQDRLQLDPLLTGGITNASSVISSFGSIRNGDVHFDFGLGDSLTISNLSSFNGLASQIDFF